MDTLPPQKLPQIVGNYPLEAAIAGWGLFVGFSSLLTTAPSAAINMLPGPLETVWAVLMLIGAVNLIIALSVRRLRKSPMLARSMFLFGSVFGVYSIAVFVSSGWDKGGATGGLMFTLAVVSMLRSRYLRAVYDVALKEAHRAVVPDAPESES